MNRISEKVYFTLTSSSEEQSKSLQQKVQSALTGLGYSNVTMPLPVLQRLFSVYQNSGGRITATLVYRENGWIMVSAECGDTRQVHYGLAADYGSTTIVMQLIDFNTGEILADARQSNGQIAYGTDILTRITYTMEGEDHKEDLRQATLETFRCLLDCLTQKTGIPVKDCPVFILSGNTTMIHFLLKLDAQTIFFAPYTPVVTDPGWVWGHELGLDFSGLVYIMPAASNYIGGDIISGLLNVDFYHKDKTCLFFDIGTNGELVIGNQEWLLAGAGAAGPALEGYISRFGMQAQNGAIDTVSIDGDILTFTTIGDQPPIGICGSGIIDLLAQMRLHGWINIAGVLDPDASSHIIYHEQEEQYVAVYASSEESAVGETLYFSQSDITQYLDTKAAAHTMVDCLLDIAGCKESDLDHCFLSGAFGAHANLESAITIGIFPDLPRKKYSGITNASLDGARTLLLDRSRFDEIRYLLDTMYCIQFASIPDFTIRMQAAKFIPHTDMRRYPSFGLPETPSDTRIP